MTVFVYEIKVLESKTGFIKPVTAVSKNETVAIYKALEMKESLWGTLGTIVEDKNEALETDNPHCEGICVTLPAERVKKWLEVQDDKRD